MRGCGKSQFYNELLKISKEAKKKIYVSECPCGVIGIQDKPFVIVDDIFCPKCNPKPSSWSKILIYLTLTIEIIIWFFKY
jgi:hypothetical protein